MDGVQLQEEEEASQALDRGRELPHVRDTARGQIQAQGSWRDDDRAAHR